MNKTIYMTYKKNIPLFVFSRWKKLNPNYTIEFSLDEQCITFLKEEYNDYIANLFQNIPVGMYKADLWRLCKLYIYGGVYADVDLVPYIDIDKLDKEVTFYSCLTQKKSIFQAFMVTFSKPKNPLLLHFLVSFLINKPYKYVNGPTFDMYNCIKYNIGNKKVVAEKKYKIKKIKIPILIGKSDENIKYIDLHYFPTNITYKIQLLKNKYPDTFHFQIKNNILEVERKDKKSGWEYNHSCDICIQFNETIFLFEERPIYKKDNLTDYHVFLDNKIILDSRDEKYYAKKGW
jgi:hypothetical protein